MSRVITRTSMPVLAALLFGSLAATAVPVLAASAASSTKEQGRATLMDNLSSSLHSAREAFLKNDLLAAAGAVDRATAYMKSEAEGATEEGKKQLSQAVDEMDRLAGDLRKGSVLSADRLNNTFAEAQRALADYNYSKATQDWADKAKAAAGRDMQAASTHLQGAWAWANQHVDNATLAAVKEAQVLGSKLAAGGAAVAEDVSAGLDKLGQSIHNVAGGDSFSGLSAPGDPIGFATWSSAMATKLNECGYPKESDRFMSWSAEFMKAKGWTRESYDEATEKGYTLAGVTFTPTKANCNRVKATYDILQVKSGDDIQ